MLKLYLCLLLVIGIFCVAKTCMCKLQDAIIQGGWIDQMVYKIITNQFIPFLVAVPLAHLISLFKLLHTCQFYKFISL